MEKEDSRITKYTILGDKPQKEAWEQPINLFEDVNNKSPDPGCSLPCSGKFKILLIGKS